MGVIATARLYFCEESISKSSYRSAQSLLISLVQSLQSVLDLVGNLVDLINVVLHLLSYALHFLRPGDRFAPLMGFLECLLVSANCLQDALHKKPASQHHLYPKSWSLYRSDWRRFATIVLYLFASNRQQLTS